VVSWDELKIVRASLLKIVAPDTEFECEYMYPCATNWQAGCDGKLYCEFEMLCKAEEQAKKDLEESREKISERLMKEAFGNVENKFDICQFFGGEETPTETLKQAYLDAIEALNKAAATRRARQEDALLSSEMEQRH